MTGVQTCALPISNGGPSIIDGFTSADKCEIAHQAVKEQVPKYEWGKCIKVVK